MADSDFFQSGFSTSDFPHSDFLRSDFLRSATSNTTKNLYRAPYRVDVLRLHQQHCTICITFNTYLASICDFALILYQL